MADLTKLRDWRALLAPIVSHLMRPNALECLDALDAIADLLTVHARARRAHNEDMRDAQREASAAFREGRETGYDEGRRGDW